MEFLNEKEAAKLIGFTASKLRNDRCKGVGLPYYKIGGAIRYLEADINTYLQEVKVVPPSTTIKRRKK